MVFNWNEVSRQANEQLSNAQYKVDMEEGDSIMASIR